MTENPCLNCGHLLDKKDKVCRYCGTQVGSNRPVYAVQDDKSNLNEEKNSINVLSKGVIFSKIVKLLLIISLVGLIVVGPLHIRELQRTEWVSPVSTFYFDSKQESINLFFPADHTYKIHLVGRNSFGSNCGLTTNFSIQDSNNVVIHSAILSDSAKRSSDSSCFAYTSIDYEFEAFQDLWLKINITIIEYRTESNSIDIEIYEDPLDYNTPEIEFWFIIFFATFSLIFFPYIAYKIFKLMYKYSFSRVLQ